MSSTYENAPATKMLATACACCSKPLVDAKSVETGVGPECRKKHGFDKPDVLIDIAAACEIAAALPAEIGVEIMKNASSTREMANRIVYRIAAEQEGPLVPSLTTALRGIGFEKLAAHIIKRITVLSIAIDEPNTAIALTAPYNPAFLTASAKIPGRRWDAVTKTTRFPRALMNEVLTALCAVYGVSAPILMPENVMTLADALAATPKVADASNVIEMPKKTPSVTIKHEGNLLVVTAPYSEALTAAFRAIRGRRWVADRKVNTFPVTQAAALNAALEAHLAGALATGTKGEFIIGAAA